MGLHRSVRRLDVLAKPGNTFSPLRGRRSALAFVHTVDTTTPITSPQAPDPTAPGAKGLKTDAIGYTSNLIIAIASTAPAYSLAATLGFIVLVGGGGGPPPPVFVRPVHPVLFGPGRLPFPNLAGPGPRPTFAVVTRAFGPQI